MQANKTLLSLCAAAAGTKLFQSIQHFDVNRVLGGVGLERRRTPIPGNLAFLAAGALVGGVAGLLFAPRSGAETRRQLSRQVNDLSEAASRKIGEARDELDETVARLNEDMSNRHPS